MYNIFDRPDHAADADRPKKRGRVHGQMVIQQTLSYTVYVCVFLYTYMIAFLCHGFLSRTEIFFKYFTFTECCELIILYYIYIVIIIGYRLQ